MPPGRLPDKDFFEPGDMQRRRQYIEALAEFLDLAEDPVFQKQYKRMGIGDKRDVHPTLKRLLDAFGGHANIREATRQLRRQVEACQPEKRQGYDYNSRRNVDIG